MAVNYSILCDVDFDVKKTQKKLDSALKGVKGLKVNIGAGKAAKEMRDLDKSAADTLLTFQAANSVFRKSIDIIESMVDQVFKLDDALTEFKKVSDLSGQALDNYVDKLTMMGGAVARTASEMTLGAAEFRKNGFNDEDAAQLAQISAMYQNVADEAVSAGDAASFIISQMIAFGDDSTEFAQHIVDATNEVANSFSVSSADIANNIGKMSAVMAQTGSSFEQSLGMLTAITEVTRSASRSSRGLVSIGSRLIEVLNENSSTGKNLKEIYESLGIELFDMQGQLRSSYDIFKDLAEIWDTLDRNTQNYIATEQAGTTQFQSFAALMQNFSTAVEASATALDSAGSASKENEKYMESLNKMGFLK